MKLKRLFLFLVIFICYISGAFAQRDSLIFKNDDVIVGEIKAMDRGVLTIETDYSDDDLTVKWIELKEIYTESLLLVSTTDGRRLYGTIESSGEDNITITLEEGGSQVIALSDVVFLKGVDAGFFDRLYAGIDLGYTLTRARNQQQFTIRSRAGYLAERWSLDATLNTLNSSQDDVEDIHRTDGNVSFRYILPKEWFVIAQIDFLSNTEQLLDLRSNFRLGLGKYIVRSNQLYWGVQTGFSQNIENYQDDENDRESQEYWLGTEVNLYDIGDLSLLGNTVYYVSLSESGRQRVDLRIDLKYDLPLDFYIKTGYTLNYDNRPVEGAQRSDYVWQTTVGWEW